MKILFHLGKKAVSAHTKPPLQNAVTTAIGMQGRFKLKAGLEQQFLFSSWKLSTRVMFSRIREHWEKLGLFSSLKLSRCFNSHAHTDCIVSLFSCSEMRVWFLIHDSQRVFQGALVSVLKVLLDQSFLQRGRTRKSSWHSSVSSQ